MPRAHLLCCALSLASCASPSRIDPPAAGSARDPWAAGSNAPDPDASDHKSSGFDLQGAGDKIAESLAKPGPYEAPRQSKGYDQAKPHWGVIRLHGDVVEREALSFTGGHGIELRQVIDRLREFARTETLSGVI